MHFFSFGTRRFSRLRCTAIGQYTTVEDAILAADGAFKKDMNFKAQTRHQTGDFGNCLKRVTRVEKPWFMALGI